MSEAIRPFQVNIPESALDDLRARLKLTRWPEKEAVTDWSQGVPLAQMQSLVDYWQTGYDWRRFEARLNALPQFITEIDGLDIYFIHLRSSNPNALPIVLTHGWPGSVLEFLDVVGPLTEPQNHGGDAADAFHVVIPALPGYGFSGKPAANGWGIPRIAMAWDVLMKRLGYTEYAAQGGDWGAAVTTALGIIQPPGLKAIHVNMPIVLPEGPYENLSLAEAKMLEAMAYYQRWDSGYSQEQMTRPQTVGYALADSPVGQAAWIYEKYWAWTDCNGDPRNALSLDAMLDNIMLYWLTNAAASSARLYWESFASGFGAAALSLPVGCSVFPKDIYAAPRSWAERCMSNLIYWNELDRGGHFAAFEQPALFTTELRNCFRLVR